MSVSDFGISDVEHAGSTIREFVIYWPEMIFASLAAVTSQ
jgi:hypothetical protein